MKEIGVSWFNKKMERPITKWGFSNIEEAEKWMEMRKQHTSGGHWRVVERDILVP
jgi:hypothetical protein